MICCDLAMRLKEKDWKCDQSFFDTAELLCSSDAERNRLDAKTHQTGWISVIEILRFEICWIVSLFIGTQLDQFSKNCSIMAENCNVFNNFRHKCKLALKLLIYRVSQKVVSYL